MHDSLLQTRALFTTWGRNILPSPKRSPTTFMPSIRGPSMTERMIHGPSRLFRVLHNVLV